jgi:hypothetical protein
MGSPVLTDMKPRLEAAAAAITDAREVLEDLIAQRDTLIVTAVDNGMSQRAAAGAAGISVPRVVAILADSQPEG